MNVIIYIIHWIVVFYGKRRTILIFRIIKKLNDVVVKNESVFKTWI